MLEFRTLGTVEISGSDAPMVATVLVQPKRLALLGYLAIATPAGFHRRDILLALLWPELDQARARNALSKSLHHLRRSLGPKTIVRRGDGEVGIDDSLLWTDTSALRSAHARGEFAEVLALYSGDLFSGLYVPEAGGFMEWLERERGRLRELAIESAHGMAARCLETGDVAGAIAAARQVLRIAPDDETGIRDLVTGLDRAGDRAEALMAYDEFESRLKADLGVSPSARTQSVVHAIRTRAARPVAEAPSYPRPVVEAETAGPAAVIPLPQETRSVPPGPASWLRWLIPGGAVIALVIFLSLRSGGSGAQQGPGTVIAISPFQVRGVDTALQRLSADLAIALRADLRGVGALRVLEAGVLEGGTEMVLTGTLIPTGSSVRVVSSLRTAGGDARPLPAVTAPAESLAVLADSLAWNILQAVWGAGTTPAPSLTAITTRSLPALRAYLDGERLISEGRWDEAPLAFARAIAADSTFWYAYWRYAYARLWSDTPVESIITARIEAHRDELPLPDQRLVNARLAGSISTRIDLTRAVTRDFPRYWPGWFGLADLLAHQGPYLGTSAEQTRRALERTLTLEPGLAPAWQHSFWFAMLDMDTTSAWRSVTRLEELRYDSITLARGGLDVLQYYRSLLQVARNRGRATEAVLDSLSSTLASYQGPIPAAEFYAGYTTYGFPEAEIEIARAVLAGGPSRTMAAANHRAIALAWAARGAWDSSLTAGSSRAARTRAPEDAFFVYRLAAVGAWLNGVEPEVALKLRGPVEQSASGFLAEERGEFAWTDGLIAAVTRDTARLALARQRVRLSGDPHAAILDRSLHAFGSFLNDSIAVAARIMDSLERGYSERGPVLGGHHPFLAPIDRLAAASWLLSVGDTAAASGLLRWHEAFSPDPDNQAATAVLRGLAYLQQARLELAAARPDAAKELYRRFLQRYDMPVARHQHLVREARIALSSPD